MSGETPFESIEDDLRDASYFADKVPSLHSKDDSSEKEGMVVENLGVAVIEEIPVDWVLCSSYTTEEEVMTYESSSNRLGKKAVIQTEEVDWKVYKTVSGKYVLLSIKQDAEQDIYLESIQRVYTELELKEHSVVPLELRNEYPTVSRVFIEVVEDILEKLYTKTPQEEEQSDSFDFILKEQPSGEQVSETFVERLNEEDIGVNDIPHKFQSLVYSFDIETAEFEFVDSIE